MFGYCGKFRIPGSTYTVDRLYASFENLSEVNLATEDNPHNVGGAFKQWLRNLTRPVIPFDMFDRAIRIGGDIREDGNIVPLKEFVSGLPSENRVILETIIKFLYTLSQQSDINKMDAGNLGIVFGPTLVRQHPDSETPSSILVTQQKGVVLMTALIENANNIFEPSAGAT